MKTLSLIIHPECLDNTNKQDRRVLEHLKELKESKSVIIISANDGGFPFELPGNDSFGKVDKKRVRNTIEGYNLVILYGTMRKVCVEYAAEAILNEGIPVAYNIKGTA